MSDKPVIHYRGKSFERSREREFHLSIVLGEGVTAWAVHNMQVGEMVALAWSVGEHALTDDRIPTNPVSVSYVRLPEWSALVPNGALVPGSEAEHLALVHGDAPVGMLRDEPVRALGATCIYSHEDKTTENALRAFPHARPLPMQALMVRGALARSAVGPTVLIHKGSTRTEIAVANKGQLLLSNTYPVHTSEDLLYFALLAAERTGLVAKELHLFVGGTHINSLDRQTLANFFANTEDAISDPWPSIDRGSSGPTDRWMAALEQYSCVS